jgi:hypothetical protein
MTIALAAPANLPGNEANAIQDPMPDKIHISPDGAFLLDACFEPVVD